MLLLMRKDYQTHVFTNTYTADVSGVCSAMYELGGMSVLHDPSGCNSTYSTHDEPRWFDGNSLMFVSGLDEMTAVMGDDTVLIRDVARAAADLKPRFITLCGASIPHIIAFDFRGVAHLIEKETGIPVLPVPTDGLKLYTKGVGMALTAWIKRFADPAVCGWDKAHTRKPGELTVNLMGVTPLDFSVNGNAEALVRTFEEAGIPVNCCMAMNNSFEQLQQVYRGAVNVVVSSAGRRPAHFMEKTTGMPKVEGLPIGPEQTEALIHAVREAFEDGVSRVTWERDPQADRWEIPEGNILVIGEEIFARSLASAINKLPETDRGGMTAYGMWPDVNEDMSEEPLIKAAKEAGMIVGDPLFRILPGSKGKPFVSMPHEAYSGRINRKDMKLFATPGFPVAEIIKNALV